MPRHSLTRSGLPPLVFIGELIAECDGSRSGDGRENNRYHNLALYRTDGGRYVLAIAYRTRWQGEIDHDAAYHATDPAELLGHLTSYDPLDHVAGFPPVEAHAQRQARLEDDITRRFARQITELYAQLPEEFAERID